MLRWEGGLVMEVMTTHSMCILAQFRTRKLFHRQNPDYSPPPPDEPKPTIPAARGPFLSTLLACGLTNPYLPNVAIGRIQRAELSRPQPEPRSAASSHRIS